MKIQQLSVFLENRPGPLRATCRLLHEAKINILALSLADTRDFGILRLIVRDWQRAKTVLEAAGRVVKVTEVVALEVGNRPGGLDEVLGVLEPSGVDIEYLYAFAGREGPAVLVFRFADPSAALQALHAGGINVLGAIDLFGHEA